MPNNGENQLNFKYGQYSIPPSNQIIDFSIDHINKSLFPNKWFQETCLKLSTEPLADILDYGLTQGYSEVRTQLANWLCEKYYGNLVVEKPLQTSHKVVPSQLFMTNGNTGALHLLMSKYTESTDRILVDNPTDNKVLNIFKEYGLVIEGINTGKTGVDLDDLETKITSANSNPKLKQNLLFYYMVPTNNNPTGISLSHTKRLKLAELCEKFNNLYIIADESFHFLTWSETFPYYPMADYHPKIISLGSFSKILAPAIRVGWIYQNNLLDNYDDSYGFVIGETSLSNSAVLESSGGINPIGYKFVEHALHDTNGIRPIDTICQNYIDNLKDNCEMMTSYLQHYSNIDFVEPNGGYYLWVRLKTIKSLDDFAKYCLKNKVKIITGNNFYPEKTSSTFIRLSFSYYNSTDLLDGLERLMDCVHKYNRINVMISGATGKLGLQIKKEIFTNSDMNYVGDIGRNLSQVDFSELDPFNSIIVDVSSSEGTYNLIKFLLDRKISIPLIIGTTGLDKKTVDLVNKYAKSNIVAHISNFSRGLPLVKEFAKMTNLLENDWKFNLTDFKASENSSFPTEIAKTIMNEITRKINLESGLTANTNTLELTNGWETLTITHKITDSNTFARGCIKYIYWILTKPVGLYHSIDSEASYLVGNYGNQNLVVYEIEKNLPACVLNKIMSNIVSIKPDTNKVAFVKHIDDDEFAIDIYQQHNSEGKLVNYCGYALMTGLKYILETYETKNGTINTSNATYNYTHTDSHYMMELPSVTYVSSKNQDDQISELISRITNLTLYGVSRYSYESEKYIILEMKEDVLNSEFLDTVCAIISSDLPDNSDYKILFINTSYYTGTAKNQIYLRCYDVSTGLEISDNGIGCVAVMEYYLYHFVKNYKESKYVEIFLPNSNTVNILYNGSTFHLYAKKSN